MKKIFHQLICGIFAAVLPVTLFAQVPTIQWNKLWGGSNIDNSSSTLIKQTPDGGYIMAGTTYSRNGDVGDPTHANFNFNYYWVVKMDADGNKQWDKIFGGAHFSDAAAIWPTTDGGYIIAGQSAVSQSGDVSGINHRPPGSNSTDYWILKLDAAGNKVWDKLLGGTNSELATSVQQTADGGFIVGGWTFGSSLPGSGTDGDITGPFRGDADYWIVKLNSAGNKVWDKILGGGDGDFAPYIQQTADGNYIVAGSARSSQSDDVTGVNHGGYDFWIVKLNGAGNKIWDRLLGGSGDDRPFSVQQTADAGYIVAGSSQSSESGDVSGINHGGKDFWVVKLDALGNKTWDKLLGTVNYEAAYSVKQKNDGTYLVTGVSGPSEFGEDDKNIWIMRLDAAGNTVWEKLYGGLGNEFLPSTDLTNDGGFIVGCTSRRSSNTGDVTSVNHGLSDIWVAKFAPEGSQGQTGTGTGLQGVYYNGINLTGTPLINKVDTTINFELTYAHPPMSPVPGIVPEDKYSVRWTGQVQAQYSQTYTFYTLSDDGIRLWVNSVLLIDNFVNQGATEKSGTIALVAGQKYNITIEYYENTGESVAKLFWSGASTPKAIIPKSQLYPVTTSAVATGTGLQAVYYKGITLSGAALLSRVDTTINFDLSYGKTPLVLSPTPGIVPDDMFSVRWSGQVQPQFPETYTFYTSTDDGVRLWVNGIKLIDNWVTGPVRENSGSITLNAGQKYDIVMEYYENLGDAVAKLYWSSASTPKAIIPKLRLYPVARGLQGIYYNGIDLGGTPLLTRIDSTINFDLSYGKSPLVLSPAPGIVPEDKYSVRWNGQVQAQYSENYTFYTLSDDGIRLWVNGVKLTDNWVNQGATEKSGTIALVAGQKYDITVEYFENTGDAVTKLYWSGFNTPKAIVPTALLTPPAGLPNARRADEVVATTKLPSLAVPFAISPNPVMPGKLAKLVIYSSNNAAAVLTVNGIHGQMLRSEKQYLVPGINTININTNGLAGGMYIVNINDNGKLRYGKMMVK